MNKLYYLALGVLFLISCSNKHEGEKKIGLFSHLVSITDNEDKGVKEVLGFYGGQCEYAIGASASYDKGTNKYFELKLSKCEYLSKDPGIAEKQASNIAYLFFKNLKSESHNYNEIHSVLVFPDETKMTFVYPVKDLELAKNKIEVAKRVVELIRKGDYETIRNMLYDKGAPANYKDDFIKYIKDWEANLKSKLGDITEEYNIFGFRISDPEKDGSRKLRVIGVVIREKGNINLNIDLDLNGTKDEIYGINNEK